VCGVCCCVGRRPGERTVKAVFIRRPSLSRRKLNLLRRPHVQPMEIIEFFRWPPMADGSYGLYISFSKS
jgi:hypothetical protein